jgi:hypothetical protein
MFKIWMKLIEHSSIIDLGGFQVLNKPGLEQSWCDGSDSMLMQ